MKIRFYFLAILSVFILNMACKKGPGVGGRATITGKVYARNFSSSFVQNDSGYLGGQKVYIKYGDDPGVGDDVETDLNGTYSFDYLREGKYTVYVYSKQLINNLLDISVTQTVEITKKKEEKVLPDFDIITFKN
jgi:hypothetical protein